MRGYDADQKGKFVQAAGIGTFHPDVVTPVLAFIPTVHLDDYFRRSHLSGKQANLLVDRNLDAFARIISAKFERGAHRPYSRFGSTLPRVDITLDDLESSGETMTDSVLELSAMWVSPDGRMSPA